MENQKDLPQAIKEILSARTPKRIPDEKCLYKHAGVLVPIFRQGGDYMILFTKRANKLEHHKGQISFPGGSVDDEDNSVMETVLREAREEIGLLKEDVEILGRIDDTLTVVSEFIVHPFVGLIPYPYGFTINTDEVARLIKVPLKAFHPENSGKGASFEFEGKTYRTPTYEYDGDVIWGATARIMEILVNIIGHKLPLREGHK
ncbi:MAG: CoA pyrophosphatase [Desulfobacterales bacterium]|nr:CoA pyrophosphatase [Desulfobacterales bacterium]